MNSNTGNNFMKPALPAQFRVKLWLHPLNLAGAA